MFFRGTQLHCNLSGKPIAIVGNCSNKPGKFTMIKINVASIRAFPLFKDKTIMDAALSHGEDIPLAYLVHTDWSSFEAPFVVVGTLVPNFFIVYFGHDPPHGSIEDDEVMLQLAPMGAGYELWAETAKDAIAMIFLLTSTRSTTKKNQRWSFTRSILILTGMIIPFRSPSRMVPSDP